MTKGMEVMEEAGPNRPSFEGLIQHLPKGSLIVLAGNPGSDKSILASHFLSEGISQGETGVYASFTENWEFFAEFMGRLGLNLIELEKAGKLRFIELVAMRKEWISETMDLILNEVRRVGAKRLVIAPYTLLAQALKERFEGRIILRTILGTLVRQLKCITLLISEIRMYLAYLRRGLIQPPFR